MRIGLKFNAFSLFLNKNFRWVVVGSVFIVFMLGVVLLIAPKWSQVSSQGLLALERERDLTEQRQMYLNQLRDSLTQYNAFTETQLTLLERILPEGFDVGPLFAEMADLFETTGYELSEIGVVVSGQTQATVTASAAEGEQSEDVRNLEEVAQRNAQAVFLNKDLRVVQLSLTLTGSQDYQDVKKLLTSIEQHQRLMDIRSIGFSITDQSAEDNKGSSITLTADIYYFDPA